MKGYIFAVGEGTDPRQILGRGVHGVRMSRKASWSGPMLATLADHTTIRPGDLAFFFQERNIYGVGEIIDPFAGAPPTRGVVTNYAQALLADGHAASTAEAAIGPGLDPAWEEIRLVIPFVPAPAFFSVGIDMDEVLGYPGADAAWGLRFWQGQSFKQLGEDETALLLRVFLRRFGNGAAPPPVAARTRKQLRALFDPLKHRAFDMCEMVASTPGAYVGAGDELRHEFVLHGLLVEALDPTPPRAGDFASPQRLDVYREIAASPPKPAAYKDSIDVMATRRFPAGPAVGIHYELIEAKAHKLPYRAAAQDFDAIVTQLMKYVDFVAHQYAGGNYAAVSATYVAYDFSPAIRAAWTAARANPTVVTTRSYVLNPRQAPPTRLWSAIRLFTYRWSQAQRRIILTSV